MGELPQHGQRGERSTKPDSQLYQNEVKSSSISGRNGLSMWRHHLCFGWHGSRWILLCKIFSTSITSFLCLHSWSEFLFFRGIFTVGEVWFHQTSCSRYPGIRGDSLTCFATNAKFLRNEEKSAAFTEKIAEMCQTNVYFLSYFHTMECKYLTNICNQDVAKSSHQL